MATLETRIWRPQKVRERIQVGVLVTRLENHALGVLEMTPSQIRATEILHSELTAKRKDDEPWLPLTIASNESNRS
jgi:hypothetical protein